MCELEKDSLESEEQHARLRQENLTLVHRANALEEQLKEQELYAEENLLAHTRKHRDALNNSSETEIWRSRTSRPGDNTSLMIHGKLDFERVCCEQPTTCFIYI